MSRHTRYRRTTWKGLGGQKWREYSFADEIKSSNGRWDPQYPLHRNTYAWAGKGMRRSGYNTFDPTKYTIENMLAGDPTSSEYAAESAVGVSDVQLMCPTVGEIEIPVLETLYRQRQAFSSTEPLIDPYLGFVIEGSKIFAELFHWQSIPNMTWAICRRETAAAVLFAGLLLISQQPPHQQDIPFSTIF